MTIPTDTSSPPALAVAVLLKARIIVIDQAREHNYDLAAGRRLRWIVANRVPRTTVILGRVREADRPHCVAERVAGRIVIQAAIDIRPGELTFGHAVYCDGKAA